MLNFIISLDPKTAIFMVAVQVVICLTIAARDAVTDWREDVRERRANDPTYRTRGTRKWELS